MIRIIREIRALAGGFRPQPHWRMRDTSDPLYLGSQDTRAVKEMTEGHTEVDGWGSWRRAS